MEHNTTQHTDRRSNNTHESFEKMVLDKINSGEIKMKPKYYFMCKVILLAIIAFLVLMTSAVMVSFIIFSLRVSGRLFLLGFGGRGLIAFFLTFPWFVLLLDLLLVILFERLLNHFKFGYRSPLLYTLGASAIVIIAGGFVLDGVSLHEKLFHEVEIHRLGSVAGYMYVNVRMPPRQEGVFRGIVATSSGQVLSNTFVMTRDDEAINLSNATETPIVWQVFLPTGMSIKGLLVPGDTVLVAGDVGSGTIRAYGIRKISPGDDR